MEKIYYLAKDLTGQSQVAAALAKIKYPDATVVQTDGLDNTAMAALISGLTDATHDDICICMPLVASHAAGKFTFAQAISLIAKIKTAKQGTPVTGTCQSNVTSTAIKLASSGPSAVNDFYNGMLVATTGTTAVQRLITDYVGSTKVATIADTTTALTTTEEYTVYVEEHLHLIGEPYYAGASQNACYNAWKRLFPDALQVPTVAKMLSGDSTIYLKTNLTATGVAAGSISDTGEFTLNAYTGGDFYVGITSATTGVGQIRKIISNTADKLTLESNWDVTPTGETIKYSIKKGSHRLLWDLYLAKAIATYFRGSSGEALSKLRRMIDQYGDLAAGAKYGYEEEALIEEYAIKGKCIIDALAVGVTL